MRRHGDTGGRRGGTGGVAGGAWGGCRWHWKARGWHRCRPASSTTPSRGSPGASGQPRFPASSVRGAPRFSRGAAKSPLRCTSARCAVWQSSPSQRDSSTGNASLEPSERATSSVTKPAAQRHDATCSSYRIWAFFFFFLPAVCILVGWNDVTHVGSDAPTRPRGCGAAEAGSSGRTADAGTRLPASLSHRSRPTP